MAKTRLLDVWIVEGNVVYREVPFTVVTDWLQQGRLVGEDKARPAGGTAWHRFDAIPALAAFLPRPEPMQVGDEAEALERVELDIQYRRPEPEEDDPDLIPLIDVTLVLLIFFMMTAAPQLLAAINPPAALHQTAGIDQGTFWIGIERGADDRPRYSLARDQALVEPAAPTVAPALKRLRAELAQAEGEVTVRVRADEELPFEVIRGVTDDLRSLQFELNKQRDKGRPLRIVVKGDVSEP